MAEVIKQFTIKLDPRTKKNCMRILTNRRTGKPFVAPSEQYLTYARDCGWFLPKLNIDYPVNIRCHFYLKTKRKCDLTNLLEAIDDIMTEYGVIQDDNYSIIAGHDGSRVYFDKENPRTEVWIERFDEVCAENAHTEKKKRTVSKKETVHGKWIICSDGYYPYCSECGLEPGHGDELTDICPSCGAVMDGNEKKLR